MIKRTIWSVLTLAAFASGADPLLKTEIQRWPDGKTAAVALTFDDNVRSQIFYAAPELEKHGFRGTFFVVAQWLDLPALDEGLAEQWQQVYRRGHEIGCHSYSHAHMSVLNEEQRGRQLVEAKRIIERWIGEGNCQLYRAPWGEGSPVVSAMVKTLFPLNSVNLSQGSLLLTTVPRSADQTIREMEKAIAQRGLYVPIWHGVGSDFMKIPQPDFERVLQYLDDHRKEIWVAPLGEITRHVSLRQYATLSTNDGIRVAFPEGMDRRLFAQSVPMRTHVPADWEQVQLTIGDSQTVLATRDEPEGRFVDYRLAPGDILHITQFETFNPASLRLSEAVSFRFEDPKEMGKWNVIAGKAQTVGGVLRAEEGSKLLLDVPAMGNGQVRGRFRMADDSTNRASFCWAGLFFRVQELMAAGEHNGVYYEVVNHPDRSDLRPNRALLWRQLASRDPKRFPMHWPDQLCASGASDQKAGDWHTFSLTFVGDRLCYEVDGKRVLDVAGLDPSPGRVGLDAANSAVEFDDLELLRVND